MLLPLGDDNRDRTLTPFINYTLIAINILVFIFLQGAGSNSDFTYSFSTVPQEIVSGHDVVTDDSIVEDPTIGQQFTIPGLGPTPFSVYITLLTSMFMHGGIAHIFGNMLFLWVFGDNLEDKLGHFSYLGFYLLAGIIASLAHVFTTYITDGNMLVPSLGASGAISGVLGGYVLLFPKRKVRVLLFRFFTQVSALTALGIWFAFQLISGIGLLGGGSQEGGVAYAAHIGGFLAGLILIKLFPSRK